MKGKKISKKTNVKIWKKGINNVKAINTQSYSKDTRGGIRL